MQHQLTRGAKNDFITRSTQMDDGSVQVEGAFWFELTASGPTIRTVAQSDDIENRQDEKLTDVNQVASGTRVIEGVASSTGIDSYGTEMSLAALERMRDQFRAGIAYAPTHARREWNEVIGRTIDAQLDQVEGVANAADADEAQYILTVRSRIKQNTADGAKLAQSLEDEDPIGQSIGGWFLKLRIHENEEGEITRVIVDDVLLDHLAATRSPSNGDSVGLRLRDQLTALGAEPVPQPALANRSESPVEDIEERHVTSVVETDDEVVITLIKSASVDEVVENDDEPEAARDDEHHAEDDREHHDEDEGEEHEATGPEPRKRTVIEYHDLPVADPDIDWQWTTEAQDEVLFSDAEDPEAPRWDVYRAAHTWYDSDNPEAKLAYKLPIARMFDGELRVVLRALSAVVGALNGARGGVDIPEEDRQGVYDHVVRYYERFGVEPPPLRDLEEESAEVADQLTETVSAGQPAESAELANPSEAMSAEEPTTDEEFEMNDETMAALRSMLGEVVGEKLAPIEQRLAAVEDTRAAPDLSQDVDEEPGARGGDDVAALRAELDNYKALATRQERAIQAYHDEPVRRTRRDRGFDDPLLDYELDSGDMSTLIKRAKAEGNCPHIVRVAESSKAFQRLNHDWEDESGPIGSAKTYDRADAIRDLRSFLTQTFTAALRDGVLATPDWPECQRLGR